MIRINGAPRGHSLDIRYHLEGSTVCFTCDDFPVVGDLLALPIAVWGPWSHVRLRLCPERDASPAELVVGDLRGRYLRTHDHRPRRVHACGALVQRLEFADRARGMSFRVDARAAGAEGHLRVLLGLAPRDGQAALLLPHLRPPPARLPAPPEAAAVIHSAP